jgi:tetratricopeptide (TPR) repeat protein
MSTVGLCIITKDVDKKLLVHLSRIAQYFDEVYLQVNGSDWKNPGYADLKVSHYKWNDNFADARNALLEQVKTDYWVWMDTDDHIEGLENIKSVVRHMDATGVDIMFAPYEYMRNDQGVVTELQNRERIIRTSLAGKWHGAIHETFIPETAAVRETTDKLIWVHDSPDVKGSMIRNRRILEAEYAKEPRDPRVSYYLGLNYGMDGHYKEAIECFLDLIDTGGWDEERYRAWLQIFSCYFEMDDYENAKRAALQATLELPEWPDAYLMLQQVYYALDDHQKSLEWYAVAKSKPTPETDSAFSPVVRVLQPLFLASYSYMATGEPKKALGKAVELSRLQPDYPKLDILKPQILRAVNEENAIEHVKALIEFNKAYDGNPRTVLDSLPAELRADVRLTKERRELIPGIKWGKGSIAYYCGGSFETWGADTLAKGMGGSEEAVVNLTRQWSKSHGNVVVYNERQQTYRDGDVEYQPWTEINPNDEFDTYIQWRTPAGIENIKARKKLVDVHDIIDPQLVYHYAPYVDKYMFKSIYHRSLYPELPDEKCTVIGNGIDKGHFNEA